MMGLRYGSVCSGIEAASVAWKPLGWECSFLSEIEPFPRAVLKHHHPEAPLHGDFTTIREGEYAPIDVLVGGTPCQSFSVAGLRGGLADDRGNLALEYLRLADRLRPKWLVWENVPGVLSSNGGRDFGSILGGMGELGYGFSYRVLDAQYFGVPQRRRRVFVVGYSGDWRPAAAVLFERHSLQGHPAPRRQAGERPAPTISARPSGGGGLGTDFDCDGGVIQWPAQVAGTLDAHYGDKQGLDNQHMNGGGACLWPTTSLCLNAGAMGRQDAESETLIPVNRCDFDVAHSLRAQSQSAHDTTLETYVTQPYTLAVRGRSDGHNLEYRADGTSNAILTPNGGRAGMGVGAIAYAIQERAVSENADAGPDGAGYREGASYTLEARQTPQAVAYNITPSQSNKDYNARASERSQAITGNGNRPSARGGDVIAFTQNQRDEIRELAVAGAIAAEPGMKQQTYVATDYDAGAFGEDNQAAPLTTSADRTRAAPLVGSSAVRRLTPRECERLQGFPDDYTLIQHRGKPAADGPRYKALGNSMAVPVMRWIGERIAMVEALNQRAAA